MAAAQNALIILAGPAGVGKSTLCDRVVRELPGFERVITATTRPPRPNEVDGRDYHFLSTEEFDRRIAANAFLEWAWVHQRHRYGTLKSAVLDRLPRTSLVMNIDVQGVRNIRAAAQTEPRLRGRVITMFVAPDSMDVLRERILGRGEMSPAELERRLHSAELEMAERNNYDYVIHSGTKEQDFRALLEYWAQARRKLQAG
ncbi:Guanylate kinase [uncultured Defluviicoccus sp.]|uniref:guanylate kinase n=1 Tax=metagenome TaxID=256318 RepID=A0A380TJ66_9ZZZZ|nr:Guanylate kinase [uncultured Defluviicoccus sp.]